MLKTKAVLAAGLFATNFLAAPVAAQEQVCGERELIVKELEAKHGEFRRAMGFQENMVVVEVYASEAGNWTILYTKPTGISCFIAVGKGWESLAPIAQIKPGTDL